MKIQITVRPIHCDHDIIFDGQDMTEEQLVDLQFMLLDKKLLEIHGDAEGNTTILRGSAIKDSIITFKKLA